MRVGVILVTYGEPERGSLAEQWVYSYRILTKLTRMIAPIPRPIMPLIATSRARGRVRLWRENDFHSPLERLHRTTVTALESELRARGLGYCVVRPGYEFRRPGVGDALRELREQGCDRAVVVPMYVPDGDFTNGMTRLSVEEAIGDRAWGDRSTLSYCFLSDDHASTDRLASLLGEHCLSSMRERGVGIPAREWAILLAAHGTVVTSPPGVDNGLTHAALILNRLKAVLRPHAGLVRLGWLNHTRGGKWTTPSVADALEEVRARGYSRVVYFPWGFTTDNAETILEGRVALRSVPRPFDRVEHLECLNVSSTFIRFIADRLEQHLERAAPTRSGSRDAAHAA